MTTTTRCICTEVQLTFVGCDCDHTGAVKVIKSLDEILLGAEQDLDHDQYLANEASAEIAYWNAQFAADAQTDTFVDPREDFAEWALEAAKHQ